MDINERLRVASQASQHVSSSDQSRNEDLRPTVSNRDHVASIVGIPQSREFTQVETQGDVRQYAAASGSRINVDSKGQFYDGELRPIDRDAASSYQRMTTEWQAHPHDDAGRLLEHLKQLSQPAIDQYVQEQKIGGLQHASPAQQEELGVRLQQRLGLAEDSASLAVIQQVIETKQAHGVRPTADENMQQEYSLDTLRGKNGPNYMREVREEDYARKVAEPALETFAAKNNVTVAQLTDDQLQQAGNEISRRYQIPHEIATTQVSHLHIDHEGKAHRRDLILEHAVGPENKEHYTWKQNSGDIESYQHNATGRFVHLDSEARFYDQSRTPVDATAALSHAEQKYTVAPHNENAVGRLDTSRDQSAMAYQTQWEGKQNHVLPGEPSSSKIESELPELAPLEQSLSV